MQRGNIKTISLSKLNKNLMFLNLTLLIGFFGLQVLITVIIGTKGSEIENLRTQKEEIRLENEIINSKINEMKSLSKIQEIVDSEDLVQKNVIYLDSTDTDDVALLR